MARFHLGNGARLERLNFLGDVSPNGLRQAHGLMVNYLYALDEIERNHEALAEKGRDRRLRRRCAGRCAAAVVRLTSNSTR